MPVHTVLLCVSVALLCGAAARAVAIIYRYRGPRVVTCPENRLDAGVELDARRILATGFLSTPELRLSSCSRWPEKAGCGQECLAQVADRPEECLVRTILADWYQDKSCVFCGLPFGSVQWSVQKPALLIAGEASRDWNAISVEHLREVLQKAKPVCFACHTANTWVREHPDYVTDRSNRT